MSELYQTKIPIPAYVSAETIEEFVEKIRGVAAVEVNYEGSIVPKSVTTTFEVGDEPEDLYDLAAVVHDLQTELEGIVGNRFDPIEKPRRVKTSE